VFPEGIEKIQMQRRLQQMLMIVLTGDSKKVKANSRGEPNRSHGTVYIESASSFLSDDPFDDDFKLISEPAFFEQGPDLLVILINCEKRFNTTAFCAAANPIGRSPSAGKKTDRPHHYGFSSTSFSRHDHKPAITILIEGEMK
jgi:hypothetical protein